MEKQCSLLSVLLVLGILRVLERMKSSGFWVEVERSCFEEAGGREVITVAPWDPRSEQGRFQDSSTGRTKNQAEYK